MVDSDSFYVEFEDHYGKPYSGMFEARLSLPKPPLKEEKMSAVPASQFDPASFLDSTTTEESVKRQPLDPGDYTGVIKELIPGTWKSNKPDAKVKEGIKFDVTIDVEVPPDQQEAKGLSPTLQMRDSIMLETNSQGNIDYSPGKNGSLRRYRDATGLNQAGQPFAPRMLAGNVVKVKVGHRIYEGEIYDEVQGVATL